jgi:Flp pilus assembly protein TadD
LSFKQVLQLVPNHSNALFALGVAYENQGRIEEAREEFKKVLQLNPDNEALQQKLQELSQ